MPQPSAAKKCAVTLPCIACGDVPTFAFGKNWSLLPLKRRAQAPAATASAESGPRVLQQARSPGRGKSHEEQRVVVQWMCEGAREALEGSKACVVSD